MLGCKCFYWSKVTDLSQPGPESFSLPAPIPQWPQGSGFSNTIINLGEIEVCQIIKLEFVWGCNMSMDGKRGVSFYKVHGSLELERCYTVKTSLMETKSIMRIRNDAGVSDFYVDSSEKYEIVAAEYLGDGVVNEPGWLQYMREWGPTIIYGARTELDRIIKNLPVIVRYSVESVFNKLPLELYGEEGPTGPKEKNNWIGDERW